jgi:subtilisin family serine protease
VFSPATAPSQASIYEEPNLGAAEAEALSIIVTAANSQQAARAVEAVNGTVTSDLWLIEAVAATLDREQLASLAADPTVESIVANKAVTRSDWPDDWDGWVTDFRFPVPWNGSPDVQATGDASVWQMVYPVSIDSGADVLHRGGTTGQGVTVAVVDSGVFFDPQVVQDLGPVVGNMFVGQVDFAGDGLCPAGVGAQHSGYCLTDHTQSYDPHGHGTHVAGTIWNNFTDQATGVYLGVAPGANILSVRILGGNGFGTYVDVIEGIQYVVANKDTYNIRVMNLSLSAYATVPYFVDPLNRAVEQAWANGIVVVAAAGNEGSSSETITVPGNDPYVITIGAVDGQRTPGYWHDDVLPSWSSTGVTLDGFVKPDVLAPGANIISFIMNDPDDPTKAAHLVRNHPDYTAHSTLFRMNGTSMATAVASGVVALMLEADPSLTPDQVKYRLSVSARPAVTADDDLVYNILQQGMGRIWAPEAAQGSFPAENHANYGMDINADLAHGIGWVDSNGDGWVDPDELDPAEMAYHYQGRVSRAISDDDQVYLYYMID